MNEHSSHRRLWICGTMLVTLLVANGCQSTSSSPPPLASGGAQSASQQRTGLSKAKDAGRAQKDVVNPGMALQWNIQSPVDQPGLLRSGQANVGPDGSLVVGPYGSCQIAGLTLEQAARQVEKKISPYIKQPRVAMRTVTPSSAAKEIVWKKATYTAEIGVARNSGMQSVTQDEPIKPADFQPLPPPKYLPIPNRPADVQPLPLPTDLPIPLPTNPEKDASVPPLRLFPG